MRVYLVGRSRADEIPKANYLCDWITCEFVNLVVWSFAFNCALKFGWLKFVETAKKVLRSKEKMK